MAKKQTYLITADEDFTYDMDVQYSLAKARKSQKRLQKIEDDESADDKPAGQVEIYRIELVE